MDVGHKTQTQSKAEPAFLELVDNLAKSAIELYSSRKPSRRILISISGIPGSGKTYLASHVVERINILTQLKHGGAIAMFVPMDGFHLYRAELDKFPNAKEAHRRRGAPFTFNVEALKALILKLKETPKNISEDFDGSIIRAPSFDHATKDPVENDIVILPGLKIVIMEGLYLSFSPHTTVSGSNDDLTQPSPLWAEIPDLFDERWFMETPIDIATERLANRHLAAGIVKTLEDGYKRANGSDKVNAEAIMKWRARCDRNIVGGSLGKVIEDVEPMAT